MTDVGACLNGLLRLPHGPVGRRSARPQAGAPHCIRMLRSILPRLTRLLRSARRSSPSLGTIDRVEITGECLEIEGWGSDRAPVLRYDGRIVPLAHRQVPRPDLTPIFGAGSERWGFALTAKLPHPDPDLSKLTLRLSRTVVLDASRNPGLFVRDGEVQARAAALAAQPGPDAIAALIDDASRAGAHRLVHRVALRLRDAGQATLAEEVLRAGLAVAAIRHLCLRDLITLSAEAGRSEDVVAFAEEALAEHDLLPALKLTAAIHLARCGRAQAGEALLRDVLAADPTSRRDVAIAEQTIRLLREVDEAGLTALLDRVEGTYRRVGPQDVVEEAARCLDAEAPYLVLRLGDGEAAYITLGSDDEATYPDLYSQNREALAEVWFRDTAFAHDPRLPEMLGSFDAALAEADCLGVCSRHVARELHAKATGRSLIWAINPLRKLAQLAELDPASTPHRTLCDPYMHFVLASSGGLARLIEGRAQVGIVTCHADLATALQHHYRIGHVELIQVPGEKSHGAVLGAEIIAGRHWPDRYDAVRALLRHGNRRGQLWLLAAGFLGKIYGGDLRRSGAVVIDIGSIADLWMGKATRNFPTLSPELIPGTSMARMQRRGE
ncbi:hypothetical protein [Methylobacterium sp. WSM2598]|uniref:hypothetical protein n=1 Tax=Methylobacterium sp. WSM2598 TaxID=398261 RepID=UPI001F218104|nr:hypothetical protein [Methylobacterium sp. WSM2598]